MKRFLLALISSAAVFLASCSSDDSSSSTSGEEKQNSEYSVKDSATVLAYTFSRFLSDSDVKIVDEDTSRLSVDTAFANRIEEGLPSVANVIAVWDKITNFPFYVCVRNVQEKNGRLLIDVDKATVYDAMPNGKFEFSSELFFDPSKVNENDEEIPPEAFYDEEKGIYHPMVLIPYNPESGSENDDDEVESVDKSDNQLVALAKENGYIDMRELVKSNWTGRFDETIFDINVDLHPGLLTIPGMGMELGDYQGSWLKLFGGMDKLQAAFAKENGFNPATTKGDGKTQQANPWTVVKAYVRVDTISYKLKTDFHKTLGCSIMDGDYIDLYVKTITDDDKLIFTLFIKSIQVLMVVNSEGQDVFAYTKEDEALKPAMLYFAVPIETYKMLSIADKPGTNFEFIPVPRDNSYSENPEEPHIVNEQIKDMIYNKANTLI